MSLSNVFTKYLPFLDLHGYDRYTAQVAINDFINDQRKLRKDTLLIIHGRGTGIIKRTTHEVLKKNKYVLEYQLDFSNDGQTIVKISI